MSEFSEIAKTIKLRREQLKYSQKDLAELTGISERSIRSIENGEVSTSIANWHKILTLLGLDLQITVKSINHAKRNSLL